MRALKPAPTTATQLIRMSWGGRAWTGRFSGSGIQRGPSAGGFETRATQLIRKSWGSGVGFETRPYNCPVGWSGVDRTVLRFGDGIDQRGRGPDGSQVRGFSAGGFETRPYDCHAIDQNVLGWSGVDRTVLTWGSDPSTGGSRPYGHARAQQWSECPWLDRMVLRLFAGRRGRMAPVSRLRGSEALRPCRWCPPPRCTARIGSTGRPCSR